MSDTIHILVEGFGEYSGRCETQIAWYPCLADAEAHKAALESRQAVENSKQPEWRRSSYDWSIATVERGKWPFPLPAREPGWKRARTVTITSNCGQSVTADVPGGSDWPFPEVPALAAFVKAHGHHGAKYCGFGVSDPASHG